MSGFRISRTLTLPVDLATKATAILAQRRKGKRLSLDTPLPTPTGWTTMGEVRVGDELFDDYGQVCVVTETFPIELGDSYRVSLSDGSNVVADAEHLWRTHSHADRKAGRPPAIVSTADIRDTLSHNGERNHYIRVAAPLDLPRAELPIDPYVLGLWLGDGTRGTGYLTTADAEILDQIRSCGYEVRECVSQRSGRSPGTGVWLIVGIRADLRRLGVLREKFIPPIYLRASRLQRQALLEGLMDSDGSIGASQPQAEFAVTSERLFDGFYELLVSLGHKATRSKRPAMLNGIQHGVSYRVQFTPVAPVFRLSRKADRLYRGRLHKHLTHRSVVAVDSVETVPMRCIAVDSPSRLFLAGESMIPTHNSYTGAVVAEEAVGIHVPFVIIDPTGAHWGLRASADGTGDGLPVTILGGQHGDLPLARGDGRLVADLVLDHPGYYILDLSLLESKAADREFVTDFAERLYRRKGQPGMDFPLLLIIDEADMFVPQRHDAGDNRMVGAFEAIVRRGGLRGLGTILISQRAAVVNKNVLEQIDLLVVLRVVGPNDRAAIDDYVRANASPEQRAEVLGSLASLALGEAWVYGPGDDLLARVQIRERRTFNSSATPKVGERRVEPRRLADVDLAAVKEAMAEALERAKQEDPAELRRELARLRAENDRLDIQVRALQYAPPPVVDLVALLEPFRRGLDEVTAATTEATRATAALAGLLPDGPTPVPVAVAAPSAPPAPRPARPAPKVAESPAGDSRLKAGARRMVEVLAAFPHTGLTRAQLATLAGVTQGGTFSTYLRSVVAAGYAVEDQARVLITGDGLATVDVPAVLTAGELVAMYAPKLKAGARRMLDLLVSAYPASYSRAELAEHAEVTQGGTFSTYLRSLVRNGLATESGPKNDRIVTASESLFLHSAHR